jgi:hypothetical protein
VVVLHHDRTAIAYDEHLARLPAVVEDRVTDGVGSDRGRDRHAVRDGGDEGK